MILKSKPKQRISLLIAIVLILGEFLIIDSKRVPLGYVDLPEQFVLNIPKTGDKASIVLLTIMMIGGMTTIIVLIKKRKTKK